MPCIWDKVTQFYFAPWRNLLDSGYLQRSDTLMPARLDSIDRHILNELQDDGRITNVELASRVGISAPPCLRRVRALEEAGYIKGYRALLDEKLLGFEVAAFAMVHLSSQAEADLASSRRSCGRSRWYASAGCCRARSTLC